MFSGFLQFNSTSAPGGPSPVSNTVTLTGGSTAIVGVLTALSVPPTNVVDDMGNIYTLVDNVAEGLLFGGVNLSIWIKRGAIAGTGKINVTLPSSAGFSDIYLLEYDLLDTSHAPDVSNEQNAGFGTAAVSITTTLADDLIVGLAFQNSGGVTASTLTDRTGGFLGGFGVAGDQEQTPAGTTVVTMNGTSSAHVMVAVALKIGGGAPPPAGARPTICVME